MQRPLIQATLVLCKAQEGDRLSSYMIHTFVLPQFSTSQHSTCTASLNRPRSHVCHRALFLLKQYKEPDIHRLPAIRHNIARLRFTQTTWVCRRFRYYHRLDSPRPSSYFPQRYVAISPSSCESSIQYAKLLAISQSISQNRLMSLSDFNNHVRRGGQIISPDLIIGIYQVILRQFQFDQCRKDIKKVISTEPECLGRALSFKKYFDKSPRWGYGHVRYSLKLIDQGKLPRTHGLEVFFVA